MQIDVLLRITPIRIIVTIVCAIRIGLRFLRSLSRSLLQFEFPRTFDVESQSVDDVDNHAAAREKKDKVATKETAETGTDVAENILEILRPRSPQSYSKCSRRHIKPDQSMDRSMCRLRYPSRSHGDQHSCCLRLEMVKTGEPCCLVWLSYLGCWHCLYNIFPML